MHRLDLKSPNARVRANRGHPWAFKGEVKTLLDPACDGGEAELIDFRGHSLGAGLYNGQSNIVWRRYSRQAAPFADYLPGALERAVERRDPAESCARLVWSEADFLPGLVVDRYGEVLVVQALSAGMEAHLGTICAWLQERFSPEAIVLRGDAPARAKEGLPREVGVYGGGEIAPAVVEIGGLEYELDLTDGQKTGFFLDQRHQHARVATFAPGRRVLDAFCHQGSFALHCAKAGAKSVEAIDISRECIAGALENALRNGLAEKIAFREANVFDFFGERKEASEAYDLIVLDPPSFARNKAAVEGALRGYKEIHLRALRLLSKGGILATYSCSQHVGRELFLAVVQEAAADAGIDLRLLETTGQPPDHPVLLGVPESEYLCGAILERV